jgi:hypothetical protein
VNLVSKGERVQADVIDDFHRLIMHKQSDCNEPIQGFEPQL